MPRIATQPQLATPAITGAATLKPSIKPNVAANNTVINSNIAAWSGVDSMHAGSFENSVRADAWSNHNRIDASNYNHSGSATNAGNAAAVLNNAGVGHKAGYASACLNTGLAVGLVGASSAGVQGALLGGLAGCAAGMLAEYIDSPSSNNDASGAEGANSSDSNQSPNTNNEATSTTITSSSETSESDEPNASFEPWDDTGCEGGDHWTDDSHGFGGQSATEDALNRSGLGQRGLTTIDGSDQGGGEAPSTLSAGGKGTSVGNFTEDGPSAEGIKGRPNLKPRRADLLTGPSTRIG